MAGIKKQRSILQHLAILKHFILPYVLYHTFLLVLVSVLTWTTSISLPHAKFVDKVVSTQNNYKPCLERYNMRMSIRKIGEISVAWLLVGLPVRYLPVLGEETVPRDLERRHQGDSSLL